MHAHLRWVGRWDAARHLGRLLSKESTTQWHFYTTMHVRCVLGDKSSEQDRCRSSHEDRMGFFPDSKRMWAFRSVHVRV